MSATTSPADPATTPAADPTPPAPPAPPPPTLEERAMKTENAKAAYEAAQEKSLASAKQAQEDGAASDAAHAALKTAIAELVQAANAEDAPRFPT